MIIVSDGQTLRFNGVERGIRTPESIGHQISSLTPYQAGPSPHRERQQRTSRIPIKVVSVLKFWMGTERIHRNGLRQAESEAERHGSGRTPDMLSKDDKR